MGRAWCYCSDALELWAYISLCLIFSVKPNKVKNVKWTGLFLIDRSNVIYCMEIRAECITTWSTI